MQPRDPGVASQGTELNDVSTEVQNIDMETLLDQLIRVLMAPQFVEKSALELMQRISQNANRVHIEHNPLMTKIMFMSWADKTDAFLKSYCRFLISIATVQMYYLNPTLRCFISKFKSLHNKVTGSNDTVAAETVVDEASIAHEHLCLLIKYVPMVIDHLPQILQSSYPYMNRPIDVINGYVKNLLLIIDYRSDIRLAILTIIIEELTKLDVHSSREDIEEAEEVAASTSAAEDPGTIFKMETDELVTEAPVPQPQEDPNRMAHEMGYRLDLCMEHLFKLIYNTCFTRDSSSSFNSLAAKALYQELLDIFQQSVMPVHQCCHVQFLIFYICSFHQAICKHFLDRLWHHVQDPNLSHVLRTSAAFYMSSMIARAKYVEIQDCYNRLNEWISWIHQYIDTFDLLSETSTTSNNDESCLIHSTFYALCQAVFYLIAFRFRELLNMKKGLKLLQKFSLERIVKCRLNPLKHCSENVTTNFANITRNYQLAYCYTIIERNRRQILYGGNHYGGHQRQFSNGMEPFFPFDPYILKRTACYITPIYRHYSGLDSEEAELEETDEMMQSSESISPKSLERSESFRERMMYGISPGFKHKLK